MDGKTSVSRTNPSPACCAPGRPRERILATALDLFHRHGIKSVGVDTIAEAAGTNKMTLYRHFGSKDELIVECLRRVADNVETSWRAIEAAHPGDPRGRLQSWVRLGAECVINEERGCALANAAIELTEVDHPARRFIEGCKSAHRDRLVRLCAEIGIAQAELLADTLSLLLEGARVSRQSVGAEGPSAKFVRMSDAVITAFAGR